MASKRSINTDDLGNRLQEVSTDRGTIQYRYDTAGNLINTQDARGIAVHYQYDALNRLTDVEYPDATENVHYDYDTCANGLGRLCQIVDASGRTDYQYDGHGNILETRVRQQGHAYVTRYQYDANNAITQIIYPNGRLVDYKRDVLGRILKIKTTVNGHTTVLVRDVHYRADNQLTALVLGNGVKETRDYERDTGRLRGIKRVGADDSDLDALQYEYDNNGNVLALVQSEQPRQTYTYDVLNRLTESKPEALSRQHRERLYRYDANGNRLGEARENAKRTQSSDYRYTPGSNRLDKVGKRNVKYDPAGNTVSRRPNEQLSYNEAGRFSRYQHGETVTNYTYNAQGQRVRKATGSQQVLYHYDLMGQLVMESRATGAPTVDYIWMDGKPVVQTTLKGKPSGGIKSEKARTYLLTDHLGTPRMGLDKQQQIVWRWDDKAFGSDAAHDDPDGDGQAVTVNLRFPGQYYDSETQLHYNYFRYYDPQTGRYITSDPIGLSGGINTYGYVSGNPLSFIDPYGLCEGDDRLWVDIAAAVLIAGDLILGGPTGEGIAPAMALMAGKKAAKNVAKGAAESAKKLSKVAKKKGLNK